MSNFVEIVELASGDLVTVTGGSADGSVSPPPQTTDSDRRPDLSPGTRCRCIVKPKPNPNPSIPPGVHDDSVFMGSGLNR